MSHHESFLSRGALRPVASLTAIASLAILLSACGGADPAELGSLPAAPERKTLRVLEDLGEAGIELAGHSALQPARIVTETMEELTDQAQDVQTQLEDLTGANR